MKIGWQGFRKYGKYLIFRDKTILKHCKREVIDSDSLNAINKNYRHWFVHPCVRFIPEGFAGHKWWMVVTPYPNYNNKYENPVLYYGDENKDTPPLQWRFAGIVQDSHEQGYNADGNLYFGNGRLWILWKEKDTENCNSEKTGNCIMCKEFDGSSFGEAFKLFDNDNSDEVHIIAPSIQVINDEIICYTTAQDNCSVKDANHPHGYNKVGVWKLLGNNIHEGEFHYCDSNAPCCPPDFDFWHADYCNYDGTIYSVVSNQTADAILFGMSNDGINFKYIETPLFSRKGNNFKYMYKPSLVIVKGRCYLFFPKRKFGCDKVDIYSSEFQLKDIIKLFK